MSKNFSLLDYYSKLERFSKKSLVLDRIQKEILLDYKVLVEINNYLSGRYNKGYKI